MGDQDPPNLPLEQRVYLTAASCAQLYDFPSPAAFRKWAQRHGIRPAEDGRRYRRTTIDRFLSGQSRPESKPSEE